MPNIYPRLGSKSIEVCTPVVEHFHEIMCMNKYGGTNTNGDDIMFGGYHNQYFWQMVIKMVKFYYRSLKRCGS